MVQVDTTAPQQRGYLFEGHLPTVELVVRAVVTKGSPRDNELTTFNYFIGITFLRERREGRGEGERESGEKERGERQGGREEEEGEGRERERVLDNMHVTYHSYTLVFISHQTVFQYEATRSITI